jgi:5-methylcytosine-specific restriction protein A
MPNKPPTFTSKAQREARADREARRQKSDAKVYDKDWRRLRRDHIQSHPLCVLCREQNIIRAGDHVDHRVPVQVAPERRVDPTNLRTVCHPHHSQLTRNFQMTGRNELP